MRVAGAAPGGGLPPECPLLRCTTRWKSACFCLQLECQLFVRRIGIHAAECITVVGDGMPELGDAGDARQTFSWTARRSAKKVRPLQSRTADSVNID